MTTFVDVHVPAQPAIPRGALFLGRLIDTVQALTRAWRAERALRERAREAHQVRELARRLQASDPGAASDLRCMADRHH